MKVTNTATQLGRLSSNARRSVSKYVAAICLVTTELRGISSL